MGIYDREYYRGESTGSGLFNGVAPVCKSIILLSAIVFLLQNLLNLDDDRGITLKWLAASPEYTFRHYRIWELVTATFVHEHILPLVFNMWFLWIIGREMEALYGSRDFAAFYVAAAAVSTLAGLAVAASAAGVRGVIVGAEGPIVAVLTLYTLYYPRREILFFFIPMPMWVLLSLYLLLPVLARLAGATPGVGVGALLAGAGFAYAYKQLDLRWSRLISGRGFRPRLRIFSPVSYDQARPRGSTPSRTTTSVGGGKASPVSVLPEEQLDARLDEVLAKIAREGRAGLTEEEQRVLQEASRRARIRRSDRI